MLCYSVHQFVSRPACPSLLQDGCKTSDRPLAFQVLGLVGTNGIGKSTALKILSGKTKPNLGKFDTVPDWETILGYFRGSELQNYFKRIVEDDLKASLKPQYVDSIPRAVRGSVKEVRAATGPAPDLLYSAHTESLCSRHVCSCGKGHDQRLPARAYPASHHFRPRNEHLAAHVHFAWMLHGRACSRHMPVHTADPGEEGRPGRDG